MSIDRKSRLFLLIVVPALAVAACQKAPEPEPAPPPQRVEATGIGIAVAALPPPFEVTTNDDTGLVLTAPGPAGAGTMRVSAGPEVTVGINLVEAVKERKAAFEATEGGQYFGNRELGTPIGPAFTARGTYPGPEGDVEETWVYTIHPGANRLLTMQFTYPTGESETRVQQVMAVLGEIEAL